MSRREEEFQRETSRFKKGLVQFLRMVVFLGASLWVTNWLFTNEYLTYGQIYGAGLPREIPEIVLFLSIALMLVLALELMFFLVYVWIRPSGRRRANTPFVSDNDLKQQQPWS